MPGRPYTAKIGPEATLEQAETVYGFIDLGAAPCSVFAALPDGTAP